MPGTHADETHTGGDAVVDALEWCGVEILFGLPSVHNLPIYDALERRGTIRVVTVRHEQAAAAAADGYARTTGRLGVFLTSTGPGAANAMGGLLEAYVSGSPVLHLTGQIESEHLGRGRGFIHEVPDQPGMLRSLSKAVVRAQSPEAIAATVADAASLASSTPQGPVSVEVPIDLQYAGVAAGAFVPPPPPQATAATVSRPTTWDRAAELIAAARTPLIWAGGGVVRAEAHGEVALLARRIGAGLLTTPNARGVLPEDDPLCIGNLPWDPGVRELVGQSDLLIGVGTRYQGPNTENWKMRLPERIVQIDIDPAIPGRNYPPLVAASGDAKEVVSYVLRYLDNLGPWQTGSERSWRERIATVTSEARARLRRTIGPQAALLDELALLISDETIVVKDSTIPAYTWGNRLLPVRRPRRSVMPNGFAIGLGLGQSLGAAAGGGGAPVVCMVGDGGFMLGATELATVAEHGLPVVVLLFNDHGYGILRNVQDKQYGRRIGVDLSAVDFCALSNSLGVEATRVDGAESFAATVKTALASDRPRLVEVDLAVIGEIPYTGTSRPPPRPEPL